MKVICFICDDELAVEEADLVGEELIVHVWPCERCQEEIAEQIQEVVYAGS